MRLFSAFWLYTTLTIPLWGKTPESLLNIDILSVTGGKLSFEDEAAYEGVGGYIRYEALISESFYFSSELMIEGGTYSTEALSKQGTNLSLNFGVTNLNDFSEFILGTSAFISPYHRFSVTDESKVVINDQVISSNSLVSLSGNMGYGVQIAFIIPFLDHFLFNIAMRYKIQSFSESVVQSVNSQGRKSSETSEVDYQLSGAAVGLGIGMNI